MKQTLPIIDVGDFLDTRDSAAEAAREIEKACREFGFFYATGHGLGSETVHALKRASAHFFALPDANKMEIALARGGRAGAAFFPSGRN
jgi:isopenicillin N synthase-like dioxygenase